LASEVDICNLALAHLGDTATVASINPPEGSPQAEHCQRFYPMARDALLEMHCWGFAMKRTALALLNTAPTEWTYAYMAPADVLNFIAVMPSDATDDYSVGLVPGSGSMGVYGDLVSLNYSVGVPVVYETQPFCVEIDSNGNQAVYTNQENAVLRYSGYVTDTTMFSPLYIMTLSWHLASMLAGPLLKGDVGASESKRCMAVMQSYLGQAVASDSNQRKIGLRQSVPWMSGR
jgi:hypothetical protein